MEKIIIIKIGSGVFLTHQNRFDEHQIIHIVDQVGTLLQKGFYVALVVSGAVAYGSHFVDIVNNDYIAKEVAAGIGQAHVTSAFQKIFRRKHIQIAQVLLTNEVLHAKEKRQHLKQILTMYVTSGFIPLINENDVVKLNSFGGNDYLAAEIAILLHAKHVVILSTENGSLYGVGGGETKCEVLEILTQQNITTDIVNGKSKNCVINTIL